MKLLHYPQLGPILNFKGGAAVRQLCKDMLSAELVYYSGCFLEFERHGIYDNGLESRNYKEEL